MSIVLRELEGRSYIHVRRKVNKVQKQRFINIDGLSQSLEVGDTLLESSLLLGGGDRAPKIKITFNHRLIYSFIS